MRKELAELALLVGGQVKGDSRLAIHGVAPLEEAGPGQITFLANPRYSKFLLGCRASALIASDEQPKFQGSFLLHTNPYLAFAQVMALFHPQPRPAPGVSSQAVVSPSVRLGKDVSVYPLVYIGSGAVIGDRVTVFPGAYLGDNVVVGDNSLIHANVSIRENCILGKRVIVHCGAVIGSDGFGYARDGSRHVKIPQVGNVLIEDDVEVGANVAIDRATLGTTVIKRGTKIDNLVQVAHNVQVGEDCLLVAQVGISGSSRLGKGVTLGGQVGVAGHLNIGEGVTVAGQSGVTKDIPARAIVAGLPAVEHKNWLKAQMSFLKLPEIRKGLAILQRKVRKLEERLKNA